MIENEYPTPPWISDTFDVPEGWLQVPPPKDGAEDRVLALDCEMVCKESCCSLRTDESSVRHGKRKRAHKSLYRRLRFGRKAVRSACQAYRANNRLSYPVLRHHQGAVGERINPPNTRCSRRTPGVDHT